MSIGSFEGDGANPGRMCLHPSVGTFVEPGAMTPRQKVAAVAKLRCLEHDLFDGGRVRRELARDGAEALVGEVNQLRRLLGWLEIDLDGQWRWPHHGGAATAGRTAVRGGAGRAS